MKTSLAARCLFAAWSATLIGISSPSHCAAGEPNDYPGVVKPDKFLAAGPLPVTLTIMVKKLAPAKNTLVDKEAELLLLTEQHAIYRLKGKDSAGKVEKVEKARAGATTPVKITQIKATDPQSMKTWTWELDAAANRFTGSVREPEKIDIKATVQFTPAQTNQFLFFTYQWMVDQLEDTVIFDDHELAKALLKKAERTDASMTQLGLDSNVALSFRNMKTYHGDLIKVRQDLERTFAGATNASFKLQKVRDMIETERRWIASTQASVVGLNFLSLVLGGDGSLAPDPFLLRHGLANFHSKQQLDIAEAELQQATRNQIQDLIKNFHGQIIARKERDKLVAKRLGLPYADWYAERSGDAASKKDWTRVVDRLTEIQNDIKKVTPHGDPWLQLEIYQTQSLVNFTRFDNDKLMAEKIQRNAANRYKLAQQIFEIVQQTPAEESFKEFRGDLIFKAAEHSLTAAELEHGEIATLRNAYNPKAVHALRLLNLAKGYKLEDVNRNVSEVRFRAMAHSQMHTEALDFGSQFDSSRDTAKFHLTMAKLHLLFAKDLKLEASKEYTKKAIKAGFYDFQALQMNADLKRVLSPDFVYENMAADVSIRINSDKKGKINSFVLTNHSPFAIFNGSFSVGKIQGYNRTPFGLMPIIAQTNYKKIDILRPRQFMVIEDSSNINNSSFAKQSPLWGFTVTNQGVPGFLVKVKRE